MSDKFTAGPWTIGSLTTSNQGFPTKHPHYEIVGPNSMEWIAHVLCFTDANEGTKYQANARLISSAPTLYEFVRRKASEGDAEAKIIVDSLPFGN
jgi:hypothetical protein